MSFFADVGAAVIFADGNLEMDGRQVGLAVAFVGRLVGRRFGRFVGFFVATAVGGSVGVMVGSSVGIAGFLDGRRVKLGSSVGVAVGSSVGCMVLGTKDIVGPHVRVGIRVG